MQMPKYTFEEIIFFITVDAQALDALIASAAYKKDPRDARFLLVQMGYHIENLQENLQELDRLVAHFDCLDSAICEKAGGKKE